MGKKTGRSPRSSLKERVATPAQKHFHYQGRKNNFPAGESYQKESAQERRQRLLEKFRKLEKFLKQGKQRRQRKLKTKNEKCHAKGRSPPEADPSFGGSLRLKKPQIKI